MSVSQPTVLAEKIFRDGRVRWQARISVDRGRLEVVAVVPASETPTVVPMLTDAELRELLSEPAGPRAPWLCSECGTTNEPGRRWCRACSSHEATQ